MEALVTGSEPAILARAGTWQSVAEAHENALVVLAMGMECSVHPENDAYTLVTASGDAERARHEIELYAREQSLAKPPKQDLLPDHPFGVTWALLWAATLGWIFIRQQGNPDLTDRFANSSLGLLEKGEWWRPFTSLFLHADVGHLLGNVLTGGLFCLLVARSLGPLLGWPLILAGGTLGNAVNAALRYPEPFLSIGASTATFAALGILVGVAILDGIRSGSGRGLRGLALPLVAGLVLFSWFGISGENTDIAGHAWGATCGLALGAAAGATRIGKAWALPSP